MTRIAALDALGEGLIFFNSNVANAPLLARSGLGLPTMERTGPTSITATILSYTDRVAFQMYLDDVNSAYAIIDRMTYLRAPLGTTTTGMYPLVEVSEMNEFLSFTNPSTASFYSNSPLHITGNRYADNITSGIFADTLMGEDGNDQLRGGAANDRLLGGSGDDSLWGQNQNDRLFGGSGADKLWGDHGFDMLDGGSGNDTLHGGSHSDTLFGYDGRDHLDGWTGNDWLYGGGAGDFLNGWDGDDRLVGHGGADRFVGGEGEDRLLAGRDASRDVFIFRRIEESTNADADRIYQFDVSTDVIDLRVIDARDHTVANNAFRWSEDGRAAWSVWAVDTRYGSRVMADTNGDGRADMSIKMIGVAGLTADDFLL